jgi:hypothetical protein
MSFANLPQLKPFSLGSSSPFTITETPDNLLKQRRFHIVAPSPNYYQMDIAFFGHFKYLIIIGVNNRYVWAIRIGGKNKETILKSLDLFTSFKTFRKTPDFVYIDCDGERSFNSLMSPRGIARLGEIMKYNGTYAKIIISSMSDPHHNRLSLVNRVIKTMRDYANKFFKTLDDISTEQLEPIIKFINNSPHSTLSRLIGFNVTPKMLLNDIELEGFIARKLMYLNLVQEKKKLKVGNVVKVIHEGKPFEKIRYRMEPEFFTIMGMKNNMYVVENGPKQLIVPGFYLLQISPESWRLRQP